MSEIITEEVISFLKKKKKKKKKNTLVILQKERRPITTNILNNYWHLGVSDYDCVTDCKEALRVYCKIETSMKGNDDLRLAMSVPHRHTYSMHIKDVFY